MIEKEPFVPDLSQEEPFEKEKQITEEKLDNGIKENPRGFVDWFNGFKNSLSDRFYGSEILRNPKVRNALIYAYIPFAILTASGVKAETGSEDTVSKFVHRPKTYEKDKLRPAIKPEELVTIESKEDKETLAKGINAELVALQQLADPFNQAMDKAVSERAASLPSEIVSKTKESKIFDFAGRARLKIEESNSYFKETLKLADTGKKKERYKGHTRKIFESGRLNFKELAKTFPKALGALELAILVHELGHKEEAIGRGAESAHIEMNLLKGGFTSVSWGDKTRDKTDRAAFYAAGINADKRFGEFLVNNLRNSDMPSQLLALSALVAKSNGMLYSLRTNLVREKREGDDIVNYARETNTPIGQLAWGLTADFIFEKDNGRLLKIVLGQEGVKIPKKTIVPMYELGESGPIIGIKFKAVW